MTIQTLAALAMTVETTLQGMAHFVDPKLAKPGYHFSGGPLCHKTTAEYVKTKADDTDIIWIFGVRASARELVYHSLVTSHTGTKVEVDAGEGMGGKFMGDKGYAMRSDPDDTMDVLKKITVAEFKSHYFLSPPKPETADSFSMVHALSPFTKYWQMRALNTSHFENHKNRETIVLIKPLEFLKLAAPTGGNKPNADKLKGVEDSVGEWTDLPYLNLMDYMSSGSTAKVTGHEGRHRAYYLVSKGVKFMPVILKTAGLRWGENKNRPEFLIAEESSYKYPCPPSLIWDVPHTEIEHAKSMSTIAKLEVALTSSELMRKCHMFIGLPFVANQSGKELMFRIYNRIDLDLVKDRLRKVGFSPASGDDNWANTQLKLNAIIRKVVGGAYELTVTEATPQFGFKFGDRGVGAR